MEQQISYRFSDAFKQKVVNEIERGKYTTRESGKIYKVSTNSIRSWLKKMGKNHLIGKVVKVEMRGEVDRLKKLEEDKKSLESALAQAHLKIIVLESTIESAEEIYGMQIKKKFGTIVSKRVLKK